MSYSNNLKQNGELPEIFLTKDSSRDKIIKTFFSAFDQIIPNADPIVCGKLSYEIESFIKNENIDAKTVRSKFINLKIKENNLCHRIYNGELPIHDFFNLTTEQMKSTKMQANDLQMVQEGIDNSQMAESGEVTDLFFCYKCKQKNCRYRQLQTRSADEPMTTFVFCKCGNTWKC